MCQASMYVRPWTSKNCEGWTQQFTYLIFKIAQMQVSSVTVKISQCFLNISIHKKVKNIALFNERWSMDLSKD